MSAFPCQNKKKKRLLFPSIFWNMLSANPANDEQDLGDIFSVIPHICCYILSPFIVYLCSLLGFTSDYTLAQTLSSSILHRTIRHHYWSIKIIWSVYHFIAWPHLPPYSTVEMICGCCNLLNYFGILLLLLLLFSLLSYKNLFFRSTIIWNPQESKNISRFF